VWLGVLTVIVAGPGPALRAQLVGDPELRAAGVPEVAGSSAGLIAYYRFDGDVRDSSGNSSHGTVFGRLDYPSGIVGRAAQFGGDSDRDYIMLSRALDMHATDYTVAFWLRAASTTNGFILWTWASGGAMVNASFYVGVVQDPWYALMVAQNADGPNSFIRPLSRFADGHWHHIAITGAYNTRHVDGYVDGYLVAAGSFGRDIGVPDGNSKTAIGVHLGNPLAPSEFFEGSLDELRVYDRILSDGEIRSLAGHPGDGSYTGPRVDLDRLWVWDNSHGRFVAPASEPSIDPDWPTFVLVHGWDDDLRPTNGREPRQLVFGTTVGCLSVPWRDV
jgi:hypothetical protein